MDMKDATLHIVKKLVGDWVSFQIALEHGMGGMNGREKEAEMCRELADMLINDPNVDPSDVGDYMEEILDEDFDTVIDDGTVLPLATIMVNLSKLCKRGSIQEALDQLPEGKPSLPDARPEPSQNIDDDEMVDVSEVDEMSDQVAALNSQRSSRRRTNEPDEDGWVQVNRTNK
ncbi:uncharacterized protein LOC100904827 [Galendromus occidentalis]|uniref:Pre-rRNA-processing protein TSR2 homolog n=1 Tax=Galendromus occidentalis TaxID=34638 RepID=A0AAJ6QY39_9ACAR|nr:uncharacterized protein LOC100904827 [Galendromus occidentalis]